MTTDAILEFRSDLSRYRDFFLKYLAQRPLWISAPTSPVVPSRFLGSRMWFCKTTHRKCIKHITGVSVLRQSDHCVYQFLCRDIRSNGKQTYHLVCLHFLDSYVLLNERIANQRAEAVKNMLVNKYRIDARRVTAKGQGVGYMFEEPDWNRVSICTIVED